MAMYTRRRVLFEDNERCIRVVEDTAVHEDFYVDRTYQIQLWKDMSKEGMDLQELINYVNASLGTIEDGITEFKRTLQ